MDEGSDHGDAEAPALEEPPRPTSNEENNALPREHKQGNKKDGSD
jgi:hypothetical protein